MANLRVLRTAAGKTLQQVASDLGVSVAAVADWERGSSPRASRIPHVAAAYGINSLELAEMFARKPKPRRRSRRKTRAS